jgi:hypothetical protein
MKKYSLNAQTSKMLTYLCDKMHKKVIYQKSYKFRDLALCRIGWVDIGTGARIPLRFVVYISNVKVCIYKVVSNNFFGMSLPLSCVPRPS